MFRNKTARQHNFAHIPSAEIPRSKFRMKQTRKMAFDASFLIPIMCEEVLPGDTWQHSEHIAARLATPIAPIIDDMDIETWYFFVPNRLAWPEWEDFITGINTSVTVPQMCAIVPSVNYALLPNSVLDHFGLLPQVYTGANVFTFNAIPVFDYFLIYNEWFRDQNLQPEWTWPDTWTTDYTNAIDNGTAWDQMPLRVNKRHDYFTSALPWAQKGSAVTLPLGTTAPIFTTAGTAVSLSVNSTTAGNIRQLDSAGAVVIAGPNIATQPPNLYADLASATAATINSIRLAFQTQKLLERDARGGSRYTEQLLSHFGTRSPDYRLQRPEYLGGSKIPVTINPIAQTAAYDADPADAASPIGNLGAEMHASNSKRTFTYASVEHGYIIGLAAVRSTPTYQQGTRRHWKRSTRLDYYFPVFAMLGEQAVRTQEIYQPTNDVPANATWGYQERWAEYRYTPNEITGVLRSTAAQPLDWWHLAEEFVSEPALNAAFITDKTYETLSRSLATTDATQWSAQIIMDICHDSQVARLMPTYSEPGLIDHF